MSSRIDPQQLFEWCRIPRDKLEGNPKAKVPIKVLDTPEQVHRWAAQEMIDELKANNAAGRTTRWILPCGPTRQYTHFVNAVNSEQLSLRDVHIFHMDDFLDWQARPLPLEHPLSMEGWMRRNFYALINPELVVPESQRHFPSVYQIDALSEAIAAAGGVDTAFGGVGYRGHIAFNEPPQSPWYTVTEDDFRTSSTRVLQLNTDTLIAVSQRNVGGCSHFVPPMAITIGMRDLLAARRIRLLVETGAWKQTVVRVLLFGPTTTEYPVTFVHDHPDVLLAVDRKTATAPFEGLVYA